MVSCMCMQDYRLLTIISECLNECILNLYLLRIQGRIFQDFWFLLLYFQYQVRRLLKKILFSLLVLIFCRQNKLAWIFLLSLGLKYMDINRLGLICLRLCYHMCYLQSRFVKNYRFFLILTMFLKFISNVFLVHYQNLYNQPHRSIHLYINHHLR